MQAQQFLDGKLQPFDFAFSYSSLEHSGLGRYGVELFRHDLTWAACISSNHNLLTASTATIAVLADLTCMWLQVTRLIPLET